MFQNKTYEIKGREKERERDGERLREKERKGVQYTKDKMGSKEGYI